MADDATERLLKEQARAHGLDAYAPEPEGVAPKTIAYAIRQDAERDEAALRGFAGLRGGAFAAAGVGGRGHAAWGPVGGDPISRFIVAVCGRVCVALCPNRVDGFGTLSVVFWTLRV